MKFNFKKFPLNNLNIVFGAILYHFFFSATTCTVRHIYCLQATKQAQRQNVW